MSYKSMQRQLEENYNKRLARSTTKHREKLPNKLRPDYCYTTKKRFKLDTVKPAQAEKDRNECATTQTIKDFYTNTFIEDILEHIPDDITCNADDTHAEVGIPDKVLVPPESKRPSVENEFDKSQHVTAMVTIKLLVIPLLHIICYL